MQASAPTSRGRARLPYAQLVGRRLVTLPAAVALPAGAVIQRTARLAPGDNEINPASVRYLLLEGA